MRSGSIIANSCSAATLKGKQAILSASSGRFFVTSSGRRNLDRKHLKPRIKSVIYFCLYYSGLEWLLAHLIRVDAVAVLMYHGVCDDPPMPRHINFHHRKRVFERQMRVLK